MERINLAMERIRQIPKEGSAGFHDFFLQTGMFLQGVEEVRQCLQRGSWRSLSLKEMEEVQEKIFFDLKEENYAASCYSPEGVARRVPEEFRKVLLALAYELRQSWILIFEGDMEGYANILELYLQIYGISRDGGEAREAEKALYWYAYDYLDVTVEKRLETGFTGKGDVFGRIIMEEDLSDLRYLFLTGEYIGKAELDTARFLNTLESEKIRHIAHTFAGGLEKGYHAMQKDFSGKKYVQIVYRLGFEKIMKEAALYFAERGIQPVFLRRPCRLCDLSPLRNSGSGSLGVNRQFLYDHHHDMGLFMKNAYLERKLQLQKKYHEKYKDAMKAYGGPVVLDPFGDREFVSRKDPLAIELSQRQMERFLEYERERVLLHNAYVKPEETAFTMMALPVPGIVEPKRYAALFEDILKVNTMDEALYQTMHQILIDALDRAKSVRVLGGEENETDLEIVLHPLKDPVHETNFENCLADVNIPVGEVFTSPLLQGTHGVLFVRDVFIQGTYLNRLKITLEDGMITGYSCCNFENTEDNQRIIEDSILKGHKTLPMGEFAIGTNLFAYQVAKKYNIFKEMPILIAEKMGPHFAFGDTCYSFEEDNMTYNPDGKAIVARDNECSIKRKENEKEAYFNCHTDITIPISELGDIFTVEEGGKNTYIIRNGKFVLEGLEFLNQFLEEKR